jgi:alpha-L-arabinofuranosidase
MPTVYQLISGLAIYASRIKATVLAGDIRAHNTFEQPNRVRAREESVAWETSAPVYRFAPASVTRLQLELG